VTFVVRRSRCARRFGFVVRACGFVVRRSWFVVRFGVQRTSHPRTTHGARRTRTGRRTSNLEPGGHRSPIRVCVPGMVVEVDELTAPRRFLGRASAGAAGSRGRAGRDRRLRAQPTSASRSGAFRRGISKGRSRCTNSC
jgi:hypothetical protein